MPPEPTPILRFVHVNNLPTLIHCGGLHAPNASPTTGLPYRSIHDTEVQGARANVTIDCGPGGVITDYVPFYFGYLSPMMPTGIFYAQGAKANVLFFDRKPAREQPWTERLWIYDLRTNQHFTLKERTLKRGDLDDFVACYYPQNRHERQESDRFKSFTYEELTKRDKVSRRATFFPSRSFRSVA